MKRKIVLIGLSIFVVCAALHEVPAQSKIITSREYYERAGRSWAKSYEKSLRVETSDETIASGTTIKSVTTISEFLLPSRSRYYTKITEAGKVNESEQITIDYVEYTRKDGGAWVKVDLPRSGSGNGMGSGTGSSRQCDQYSVEPTFINGRSVQLFSWLSIDGNGDELMFREMRKWIGENGSPYREEDLKGKLSPRDETRRTITTYEYDPDIRIEAPIK